ncbi:hypothetical protein D910_11700 [Dendroctonus ponderosae]|uniref:NADP-dependent oxidoreductase domain-containing protein n=1 Tax=Dendroctonus ponderosae TaxID=77166 RepID=U4UMS9_DENPD|nr:hypothetical protein D910_11700 [Dendroctonus ponderosae]
MPVPKTVKLYTGVELPTVGLGTYTSTSTGQVEDAVKAAIDSGYRHIDCAWFYGNEAEIGKAIKAKISSGVVKREDLFITSKVTVNLFIFLTVCLIFILTQLWNNFHAKSAVLPKLKETLQALQLEYLDLYLIHWPFGLKEDAPNMPEGDIEKYFSDVDYLETWGAMEEVQKMGLTKSIGVSNFNSEQITRLIANSKIKPVVNQVECNPNLNQKKLIKFCKERDIVIVGYTPLGRSDLVGTPGFPVPSILDEKVAKIAQKYKKTPAQVVLNYLVANLGIVVIPKSVTPSRIKENIDIYDFELEAEDVAYFDSMNRNLRVCGFTDFKNHKYYAFNAEF